MRARLPLAVAGGALAGAIAGLACASAASAQDELEVSPDGSAWSQEYRGTLFEGPLRLAPGDSVNAVVYVRNAAADAGVLTIAATGAAAWSGSESVFVVVRFGGEAAPAGDVSRSVAELAAAADFGLAADLGPGAVARIDISLRVDVAAPNGAQERSLDLGLGVRLAGDSVEVPVVPPGGAAEQPGEPGAPPGGPLAGTGARVASVLAVAGLAIGVGAATRGAARRRT